MSQRTCVPIKAAKESHTVQRELGRAHTIPMQISEANPIPEIRMSNIRNVSEQKEYNVIEKKCFEELKNLKKINMLYKYQSVQHNIQESISLTYSSDEHQPYQSFSNLKIFHSKFKK